MILTNSNSFFIVAGFTDMRKSINTLLIKLAYYKDIDVYNGDMYIFCGKNKKNIKILFFDTNGFCLLQKKVSKFHFYWPKSKKALKNIKKEDFVNLLNCLKICIEDDNL